MPKLGRLPEDTSKPRLNLENYLSSSLTPPASADWISHVPTLPMFGNDEYGDFTCAAVGHLVESLSFYGQGVEAGVTDAQVISMYERVCPGFDPATDANDNGATLQDALNDWHKTGLAGHKVAAFARVKTSDTKTIKNCINLFGSVYAALEFPVFAMDQFNKGSAWDIVGMNTTIEGGHAVPLVAYDADGYTCVTWG